jgi:1-acyl-sn-glycerol-3-phosphate acyltransferase
MKRVAFLRSLFITDPLIILATVIFGATSLIVSFFDPTRHKQNAMARAWARVLLAVSRVKVKVEGLEKIKEDGSYVFVSNHLS